MYQVGITYKNGESAPILQKLPDQLTYLRNGVLTELVRTEKEGLVSVVERELKIPSF